MLMRRHPRPRGPDREVTRRPVVACRSRAEAWGTDILKERSFLWLVASRLFILMGGSVLTSAGACSTSHRSHAVSTRQHDRPGRDPAGRSRRARHDRIGSCRPPGSRTGSGASRSSGPAARSGRSAWSSSRSRRDPADRVRRARCCSASSAGTFLAVDWALMTDIIPKASSGRYMGSVERRDRVGRRPRARRRRDDHGRRRRRGDGPGARALWHGGRVRSASCSAGRELLLRPVDERAVARTARQRSPARDRHGSRRPDAGARPEARSGRV